MDNFFSLLARVVMAQGGDPSSWSNEYQDAAEELHALCHKYAQSRFERGYNMGFAHAKGETLDSARTKLAVDSASSAQARTEIVVNCEDLL